MVDGLCAIQIFEATLRQEGTYKPGGLIAKGDLYASLYGILVYFRRSPPKISYVHQFHSEMLCADAVAGYSLGIVNVVTTKDSRLSCTLHFI
jgi:hypothetical protein